MTLTQQVYAQTILLAGSIEQAREPLLELLCQSAVVGITRRLRDGLTPEDCKADFVAAGALYALAALTETDETANIERLQFGDITMVRGGANAAARCLRHQADYIISPYCVEAFAFRGV